MKRSFFIILLVVVLLVGCSSNRGAESPSQNEEAPRSSDESLTEEPTDPPEEENETQSAKEFKLFAELLIDSDVEYTQTIDGVGTFTVPAGWATTSPFVTPKGATRYLYYPNNLLEVADVTSASNFFVESSVTEYTPDDAKDFLSGVLAQFLIYQKQNPKTVLFVEDEISETDQGYPVVIITISEVLNTEDGVIRRENRLYFILGDYKVVVVNEDDFLNENIPLFETAQAVLNSFVWS